MGNPTIHADTPQDHQRLTVVVLPVEGVGPQKPPYLTGRAWGGAKQNTKRVADVFKVVDFSPNVEYDDRRGLRAGRIASQMKSVRPAFSFSLSFQIK
jgi:hypothetical protein